MSTTVLGGDNTSVCVFFSFNCKLDFHVLQGNVNSIAYRENVLNARAVPRFDNHPLIDRSIFNVYV